MKRRFYGSNRECDVADDFDREIRVKPTIKHLTWPLCKKCKIDSRISQTHQQEHNQIWANKKIDQFEKDRLTARLQAPSILNKGCCVCFTMREDKVEIPIFKEIRDCSRDEESIQITRVTAFDNRLFGYPNKKQLVKQYNEAIDEKDEAILKFLASKKCTNKNFPNPNTQQRRLDCCQSRKESWDDYVQREKQRQRIDLKRNVQYQAKQDIMYLKLGSFDLSP